LGKSVVEQKLLEYPDVFADVCNAYCFGGEAVLREDGLEPMTASAFTRDADDEMRGRLRDVRKKCYVDGREHPMICQIENQTDIDNTMPVRMLGYEYAAYEEQIDRYQDENKKNKRDAGSRRIFSDQKLTPVMTLVLNYGDRRWKRPLGLHDMMKWPEKLPEEVKRRVVDYPLHVVDVAYPTKEERMRLKSDFRIVAEYLACKDDIEEWEEFLKEDPQIRHVEALLDVLGAISKDEKYDTLLELIRKKGQKEEWSMCYVLDEYMRRGLETSLEVMKAIQEKVNGGTDREITLQDVSVQFEISQELVGRYYDLVAGN